MSVRINGKTVAGGFTSTPATKENRGIVRIATDEEAKSGSLEDVAITPKQLRTYGGGGAFELFDTKLSDHILSYEETKGWALQGTYVYSTAIAGERYGYPDFINKCIEEKETGVATQVTLGDSIVTMYINSNGHQFYDIADKGVVDTWFNTYGIADFYGVDTENECVFLPRNIYFMQLTNDPSKVNDMNEAGLPTLTTNSTGAHTHTRGTMNITGSVTGRSATSGFSGPDGTFTGAFEKGSTIETTYSVSSGGDGVILKLNASKSWTGATSSNGAHQHTIAGTTDTVQPPSSNKLLYYCVGNTVSDTFWIDAVTQVEAGVKDLEDKTLEGIERLKQSSTALTQTDITNCLLEVPQRIKYELNNGTLTVKAGTQVIVPYGTERNVGIIGSVAIDENGVASGFIPANADRLVLPNLVDLGDNFEIFFKFTTGNDLTSDYQVVFTGLGTPHFTIGVNDTGYFDCNVGDGTDWLLTHDFTDATQVQPNTTYYFKVTYDGTRYSFQTSTDNTTWKEEQYLESTNIIPAFTGIIGQGRALVTTLAPSEIYLDECYIKINGEEFWSGKKRDLATECPVGSTFITDNFKVVGTQQTDGKCFVWSELQNDSTGSTDSTGNHMVAMAMGGGLSFTSRAKCSSGVGLTPTAYSLQYDTSTNYIRRYGADTSSGNIHYFPILDATVTEANKTNSINQVFNGVGKIGSIYWIDKGVTALSAKGKNQDGSINNVARITEKLEFLDNSAWDAVTKTFSGYLIYINCEESNTNTYIFQPYERFMDSLSTPHTTLVYAYIEHEQQWYFYNGETDPVWRKADIYIYANMTTKDGELTPKQPFRAVDQNSIWYSSSTSTLYIGV